MPPATSVKPHRRQIALNGKPRVIFVEDRFKAEGYDTQNAVHWPLVELNLK